MELAGRHIRELHAAHVKKITPARDRMIALDKQLSELLDRENELRAKRLGLLRELRQQSYERCKKEFEDAQQATRDEIKKIAKKFA